MAGTVSWEHCVCTLSQWAWNSPVRIKVVLLIMSLWLRRRTSIQLGPQVFWSKMQLSTRFFLILSPWGDWFNPTVVAQNRRREYASSVRTSRSAHQGIHTYQCTYLVWTTRTNACLSQGHTLMSYDRAYVTCMWDRLPMTYGIMHTMYVYHVLHPCYGADSSNCPIVPTFRVSLFAGWLSV